MRRAVCQLSWVSCFIVFYVSFFHFSVLCTYYMCCISCQFSVSVIGKIRTRCTASCFQREIFNFAPPLQKTACSPPRARSYLNFRICVPRKYKVKTTSNAFALRTLFKIHLTAFNCLASLCVCFLKCHFVILSSQFLLVRLLRVL